MTANQEHRHETDRKQHRRLKANFSTDHRRDPVKDLHRRRNSNQCRTGCKEGLSNRGQPDSKHMVSPHSKAEEANSHTRPGNKSISKDRLTRENRNDLRNDPESGQDQDIDLWMPKGPEEVL